MKPLRPLIPNSRPTTYKWTTCQVAACKNQTKEGKPYCIDHVHNHTYVKSLLATIAKKEHEEATVASTGPSHITANSLTLKDILVHLRSNGPRTYEKLSQDMGLSKRSTTAYTQYLHTKNLVTFSKTNRGSTMIHATDDTCS